MVTFVIILLLTMMVITFSTIDDNRNLKAKYYKHVIDDENGGRKMAGDMVALYADYKKLYAFVNDPEKIDTRSELPRVSPPSVHFKAFRGAVKQVYNKKESSNDKK